LQISFTQFVTIEQCNANHCLANISAEIDKLSQWDLGLRRFTKGARANSLINIAIFFSLVSPKHCYAVTRVTLILLNYCW